MLRPDPKKLPLLPQAIAFSSEPIDSAAIATKTMIRLTVKRTRATPTVRDSL
jgi:hypothetical protein